MRVLIAGGTGLLGHALLSMAPDSCELLATSYRHAPPLSWQGRFRTLDVRDTAEVMELVGGFLPDVVVHTASVGSVDEAERDPDAVRRINVGGLAAIGRACERVGARLVFISSNAVFDGSAPPYGEDAPRRSVNRYGALKIEAEQWLESSGLAYAIIRPILMYGWPLPGGRGNVVTRWLADFERSQPVHVAEDICSMPLAVTDAAAAVWAAVRLDRRGIYHIAGRDRVWLADFARETARVFGYRDDLVVPVPGSSFATLAPRPADTSFVTARMERDLGVRPLGIHDGLLEMQRTRALVR